jgi:hypothetical protein
MSFPDDRSIRLENVDVVLTQKIPEKAGVFKSLICDASLPDEVG